MLYKFPGLEKRSPQFRRELWAMGQRLDIDPNFIASVMQTESGFDPHQPNIYHRHVLKRPIDRCAYGLIQFLPSLLRHYGTTATELAQHDATWQLRYVERFFAVHSGKIMSPGDAYMGTFLPAYMGKGPSFVLGVDDDATIRVDAAGHLVLVGGDEVDGSDPLGYGLRLGAVYEQNAGFDRDRDGAITVGEVTATAERNYREAMARGVFDDTLPNAAPVPHADPAGSTWLSEDTDGSPPRTTADDIPWLPMRVSQEEHNEYRDAAMTTDEGGLD